MEKITVLLLYIWFCSYIYGFAPIYGFALIYMVLLLYIWVCSFSHKRPLIQCTLFKIVFVYKVKVIPLITYVCHININLKIHFMDRSITWSQILWKFQKCKIVALFENESLRPHMKVVFEFFFFSKTAWVYLPFKKSCLKPTYAPLRMGSAKTIGVLKMYPLS